VVCLLSRKLAPPKFAWMNGRFVEWDRATVHVSAPIVNYGSGAFEGIRAYASKDQKELYVVRLKEHIRRFFESAKVLRLKIELPAKEIEDSIVELLRKNEFHEDVYIRPLVMERGGVALAEGAVSPADLAVFSIPFGRVANIEAGIRCCFSSWRRIPDVCMPPRVKSCGNYVNSTYARKEALAARYDEALLLTIDNKVSEAGGANLFMVKGGVVVTPPVTASILEGVTREGVLHLASKELSYPTAERDIDRTELYLADEVFLCGTGEEVAPVISIDGHLIGDGKPGEVTKKLQTLYFDIVRGAVPKYRGWITPVYGGS